LKKFAHLFTFLALISCQFFENQQPSETDLLKKQLKEIDWKTVDQPPSILRCDSLENVYEKKDCFFQFFTDEIKSKLKNVDFSEIYPKNEILNIKVSVIPEKELIFEAEISNDSLIMYKPQLDSVLAAKLIDFPVVAPAIKQGVFVKSVFYIPYKVSY
jgi:hypothetical protein